MRATRFWLAGLLASCSNLSRVLPDASVGEPRTPAPEEATPARTRIASALTTFQLPNGLTVVLLEDPSLPKVVIDTWFDVGSKDEAAGRSGFAHLFEHLMFMGTARVPDDQFDVLMERGGGSNNASTSQDRTNYFSMGPASLLPTLLWLDADRLDALDENMTQAKLDRQREIVRNERRQNTENVPYGKAELLLPGALYPPGHPYHHPVIGSHADLEAATLADVIAFFREFYVPANATLVVAGDFEPAETRALIERTFGAVAAGPKPARRTCAPVVLDADVALVEADQVEFPKLTLAWHSPASYAPGDAELDLLATILAEGPASRLEQRLVLDTRLAQEVSATQQSSELGSLFLIEALAAPGADLEALKREVLSVLRELCDHGPSAAELARAQARAEARFLRRMESLLARAEAVQAYRHFFGVSDGFQRDLERWTAATAEGARAVAREIFDAHHVDLRILPALELDSAALDARPADFPRTSFRPATPASFALGNGIPVHVLPHPGSGLFSLSLLVAGGELALANEEAGGALLAARWIDSGAGGLTKSAFAEEVEGLGASLSCSAARGELTFDCSGLASRLAPTLDRLRDLVRAPNLAVSDFEREKSLAESELAARDDDPNTVARTVGRALLFGAGDPRGRPLEGTAESLAALDAARVRAALATLLAPERATFVAAGDFEPEALRTALEARFGDWRAGAVPAPVRIVLVDRPGAPQTVVQILRPLAVAEGPERAARAAVDTVFGGTFTSRLNANLREAKGYTYGARSRISQEARQGLLSAGAAVSTPVTGPALLEFQREFARLAAEGITAAELEKALETARARLVETAETTAGLTRALAELVRQERPLDSLAHDFTALERIDLDAANREARSGLYDWSKLLVVLVGDRATVLDQLAAHGFPAPLEVDTLGQPR